MDSKPVRGGRLRSPGPGSAGPYMGSVSAYAAIRNHIMGASAAAIRLLVMAKSQRITGDNETVWPDLNAINLHGCLEPFQPLPKGL